MAPRKTAQTPTKPLTDDEKAQAIAQVNARAQAGELDAEAAQGEIDAINGVARVTDEISGDTFVVDSTLVESGEVDTDATSTSTKVSAKASAKD